jgi:hypothetical protein
VLAAGVVGSVLVNFGDVVGNWAAATGGELEHGRGLDKQLRAELLGRHDALTAVLQLVPRPVPGTAEGGLAALAKLAETLASWRDAMVGELERSAQRVRLAAQLRGRVDALDAMAALLVKPNNSQ